MEKKDEEIEISKKLDTRIKVPKEEKEKIYSKLVKNFLIAIAIFIYICFLNLGYVRLDTETFRTDLKVFAIILILFTIFIFENAYRDDNDELAVHGIEMLVLSIITLYLPYVYFHQNEIIKLIFETAAIYIAIYYTIKCIIIYKMKIRNYKNGLSDVKEITKEKTTYLDEKSSKKFS